MAHAAGEAVGAGPAAHAHPNYVRVWAILVGLLVVSVVGPLAGLWWLTLITAFAIAVVKALMVAAYFMHLNIERAYVKYLLFVILGLMLVLFSGVAPDVMKPGGANWRHTPEAPAARPGGH
jgi:caa(3)-type oxidase subunit IV